MASVEREAVHWLISNFGNTGNTVRASKLHKKQSVWWLEIPLRYIETPASDEIDLLCKDEETPGANKFHYLKVPVKFFKGKLSKLCLRKNGKLLSLLLSAEPETKFADQRGNGGVDFSSFLQKR